MWEVHVWSLLSANWCYVNLLSLFLYMFYITNTNWNCQKIFVIIAIRSHLNIYLSRLNKCKKYHFIESVKTNILFAECHCHQLYNNDLLLQCRYRNLIERALRARLVYGNPNMNRSVSFEYMNRQLVWNEFSVIG